MDEMIAIASPADVTVTMIISPAVSVLSVFLVATVVTVVVPIALVVSRVEILVVLTSVWTTAAFVAHIIGALHPPVAALADVDTISATAPELVGRALCGRRVENCKEKNREEGASYHGRVSAVAK